MAKDDKRYPWTNRYKMLFLLASLLLLTACTVTLLSGYNPELTATLTKLQKQINTMLITIKQAMGTKQAAYQPYKKQIHT